MQSSFFLSILFVWCGYLSAQPLTAGQTEAIDQAFMADIPAGGPGGVLGIVRDGKVIYTNYAGLADLDDQRPISADTRFNIASNAKQFTAIAALQLICQGKLRLEDDVRKYLPELYPQIKDPITIAHLLNHTSGIRDVYNLWGLQGITWWKKTLTNDDALALLEQQRELNFKPGSRQLYSNSNYILLTHVIARVSGKSFREYSDELFQALGMASTNFVSDHEEMGPNVGRPYFNFDTWSTYQWRTDLHGDGSLFSSLNDQLTWEIAVQNGMAPGLDKALIERSQGPVNEAADYGFGLERGKYRGLPVRWHDGSTGAWDASFLRFPDQKLTIVAADNSGKFGTNMLVRAVADVLLEDVFTEAAYLTEPAEVGTAIPVEEIIGTYLTDNGYAFTFKLVDGALVLERDGRNDVELELDEGNIYQQKSDPAFKQEFTRNADKGMQVTAYYWAHAPYSLVKTKVDWSGYEFAGLEGNYVNDELDVNLKVTHVDNQRYGIRSGTKELRGEMYRPDRLLASGGKNITVRRDAAGRVTELWVSDDRTINLRFVRE